VLLEVAGLPESADAEPLYRALLGHEDVKRET
jgi:hypothetical protein